MSVRWTQILPHFRYNLVTNDKTYFFNSFWGVFWCIFKCETKRMLLHRVRSD
jgi:hypothetical protein